MKAVLPPPAAQVIVDGCERFKSICLIRMTLLMSTRDILKLSIPLIFFLLEANFLGNTLPYNEQASFSLTIFLPLTSPHIFPFVTYQQTIVGIRCEGILLSFIY